MQRGVEGSADASSRPPSGREEVVLAAQPASVSAARRFVRDLPDVASSLVEDSALVASELVANAVLHAGGPIRLSVTVWPDGSPVRIEVADASPIPPVLRAYDTSASTGRGLTLVARLATRWGVEQAGSGKRVWVELVAGAGTDEVTAPTTMVSEPALGEDGQPFQFVGVPVALYLRLQEQNDAVLRELELLAFTADHAGHLDPSPQLVEVIERSRRYFNLTREGFRGEVAAAAGRGEATVDLEGTSPRNGLVPAADLVSLFEQAEALARRGELLIGPPSEEVGRLRRWFVDELTAQLVDGSPPQPFLSDGHDAGGGPTDSAT